MAYQQIDRAIRRLRRAPHVASEDRRIVYRAFELDLERGPGAGTGQGRGPTPLRRLWRDGGETWSEPVSLRAGALGETTTRAVAHRLRRPRGGGCAGGASRPPAPGAC